MGSTIAGHTCHPIPPAARRRAAIRDASGVGLPPTGDTREGRDPRGGPGRARERLRRRRQHRFAHQRPLVTAAAVALTVAASGMVKLKTTVLMTPEEVDQATKKSLPTALLARDTPALGNKPGHVLDWRAGSLLLLPASRAQQVGAHRLQERSRCRVVLATRSVGCLPTLSRAACGSRGRRPVTCG